MAQKDGYRNRRTPSNSAPQNLQNLQLSYIFQAGLPTIENKIFKKGDNKNEFTKALIPFLAVLGLVALLVLLEPDLGTTMVICITALIMFLLSGKNKEHRNRLLTLIPVILLLGIAAIVVEPYRMSRIQTYFELIFKGEVADPRGSGYQMQQILIGIGSGGFFGKGFGQSRQRFGYLVENTAFTDSTFAVLLEEFGLAGGIIMVTAWILFLTRGLKISLAARDSEGKYLAAGITIWLTSQAFLNMAANVGLIPFNRNSAAISNIWRI